MNVVKKAAVAKRDENTLEREMGPRCRTNPNCAPLRKQQQTFLRTHETTQRRRRATHPRRRKQHTSSNAQRASRRMWEQQGAAWRQVFPALARANCSFVDESALWKQGGKCKRRELGRRVRGASNIHIFSKLPFFHSAAELYLAILWSKMAT